ncbi:LysM peptidoglycan-binding domain-containing protein [Rubritalea spongiae]|uniref:LysM peptidoglycan-binding domain-containing protein n=1 Tax=Rubritalea spongiae TaxID=430797 RepID=A0ABW5E0R8_9BACT
MKPATLITATLIGSLSPLATAATSTEALRAKCNAQELTIQELEKEVDKLHALLEKNNAAPQMAAKSSKTAPQTVGSYTIRSGDTFSKIAKKNGISLNTLLNANKGVSPNRLSVGQTINLPGATPKVSAIESAPPKAEVLPAVAPPLKQPKVAAKPATTTKTYTVQKGDSLYKIARENDTTVANLLELNQGLNPSKIQIGQNIKLSSGSSSSISNSPSALAKQQATPKKAPVTKSSPVPKKEIAKQPAPQPKTQPVAYEPKQVKVRTVSVTRQMTFGEFASAHGASVDQINEMNGLKLTKSTVLAQGSELYIPNIHH